MCLIIICFRRAFKQKESNQIASAPETAKMRKIPLLQQPEKHQVSNQGVDDTSSAEVFYQFSGEFQPDSYEVVQTVDKHN